MEGVGNCGCSDPINLVNVATPDAGEDGLDGGLLVHTNYTSTGYIDAVSGLNIWDETITNANYQLGVGDGYRIQFVITATGIKPGTFDNSINVTINGTAFGGILLPSDTSEIFVEMYLYRNASGTAVCSTNVYVLNGS